MKDVTNDPADLAALEDVQAWHKLLADVAEERGYFNPLGSDHVALFSSGSDTLLVTFENADIVHGARANRQPLGWALTRDTAWSSLVILSKGQTWFRDRSVYAYFDRLGDDGFFDGFKRIVFFGAGSGGYAAAAFSVSAPGATVLAISPQATLAPDLAAWDKRFPAARRREFTRRYGYAPDMIGGAETAFVLHDPDIAEDAMHATLFRLAGAEVIATRHFGPDPARILESMGVLQDFVMRAAAGTLDPAAIHRILRQRHNSILYLKALLNRLEADGDPRRIARLCRAVLARKAAPRFRNALQRAEKRLATRPVEPVGDR